MEQIGLANVGWKFWLWVLSGNLVAIVFVFLLCPETGGKTLEQVDYLFSASAFAIKMNKMVDDDAEEAWEGGKTVEEHVEAKAS